MTEQEFAELTRLVRCRVPVERDIDAWVDAVLAGEPKERDDGILDGGDRRDSDPAAVV